MSFTSTDHETIRKTAKNAFIRDLKAPPAVDFGPFVTDLTTDSGEIDVGHFGALPLPRKWQDSRAIRSIKSFTHRIRTETWDHSMGWKEKTFRRDKTGTATKRASGFASKAQEWYGKMFTLLLENGNATTYGTTYDGKALFSTTHDESGSNQANLVSTDIADPTAPTIAEVETSFKTLRQKLRSLKDDQGNPQTFPNGFVAMVCHEHETVFSQVLNASGTLGGTEVSATGTRTDSAMSSGLYRGQAQVVVNPWMTVNDRWILLAKGGIGDAGLLARLMEQDWRFRVFDGDNSVEHSRNLTIEYHGDAEIGFGYALWQRGAMQIWT